MSSILTAIVYDLLLEPLLSRWKDRIGRWVATEPGMTVDICCGTGEQCRLIAKFSPVVGLDLDLAMLKYARSRSLDIHYVCGDAGRLPFKDKAFQNANISLALHDKVETARMRMIEETSRILNESGHLFLIDFEKAESTRSRIGYAFIYIIEFLAGRDHFANSRQFVKSGGLAAFTDRHHLVTDLHHSSAWGCSSIKMTHFNN
ncbi:methyltransferase domain-containing protein [candidate division KSB1 bacterium]|nr:methyltransferase domain-containing protein [candidate division KSB1 bacterium]RQW04962.1 MAG: methyltransferase domain-containing protein [candidate division KSB1 bacterium]